MRAKAQRVKAAVPASIAYALKANPHPRIAEALAPILDGVDVSSARELAIATSAGFAGERVTFSGPGKTASAIAAAQAAGARITAESEDQWARIGTYAPRAVRVNPRARVHAYRVAMGGVPSPFGVDEEALWALPDPIGVQVFAGSVIDSPRGVMRSVTATLDLVERLGGVDWVSFGGGWTPDFDVERFGAMFGAAVDKFRAATGCAATMGFELGRHLVADAGIYVARVVSVKDSRGTRFVVLDGGLNHNLFATGHVGGDPPRVRNVSRSGPPEDVVICGPLCTPLDTFGNHRVAAPRVGDLFVFAERGAYGLTASPQAFIHHDPPAEIFASDGTFS
ncbi:MAG: pyridoxal-dependent decarboxylase, exosortase A system-associated [Deltaproteobacteria bacterium]